MNTNQLHTETMTQRKNVRPQPREDLTPEEDRAECERMVAELDGHTTRAQRRVWWFARDSGMTVEQFTKAHWWVRAGFNNRTLELFWWLCQNDNPAHQSLEGFLDACRNDELIRFRNVGPVTIKQALKVLGYQQRRTRCETCGALSSRDRPAYKGGKKVDLFTVTKTKQGTKR